MSFSDAIGQIDQIFQLEQQLVDPAASTGTASTATAPAETDSTSSDSQTSFADALAAAQATTETSAAATLTDPDTDTSIGSTDGTTDTSDLLGGGDSQLLSALSSMTSDSSTGSADALDSTDALESTGALSTANALGTTDTLDPTDTLTDSDPELAALESAASQPSTVTSDSGPAGGEATSAADPRIQAMTEEANALVGKPYVWGGGHDGWGPSKGYDCSGFVSAVLHAGGYLSAPQDTATLPSASGMEQGPGQYVTVYDRDESGQEGHVIIDIDGQFYESGGEHGSWGGGGGVEEISTPSQSYLSTFNEVLHPAGL